jgi:ABC-type spermidine/putrescine transport system permease subunit I
MLPALRKTLMSHDQLPSWSRILIRTFAVQNLLPQLIKIIMTDSSNFESNYQGKHNQLQEK